MKPHLPKVEDCPEIFHKYVQSYSFVVLPHNQEIGHHAFLNLLHNVYRGSKGTGRYKIFLHALKHCKFKSICKTEQGKLIIKT